MGINGWELMVLLVVALLVIGPERLPQAAEQLGRVVRELRRVATGARERVREELGPEVADIDLAKLDPRQYDPRRIVREALTEDIGATPPAPAGRPTAPGGAGPAGATSGAAALGAAAAGAQATPGATDGTAPGATDGTAGGTTDAAAEARPVVPFDDEAT